jgi:hypothetical protein
MRVSRRFWPFFALLFSARAQVRPGRPGQTEPEDIKLPDGRSQREAILKAAHAQSLEDTRAIRRLADEILEELEKNDRHVLSIPVLKKTEEIEKLARRLRGRLKM